MRQPRIQGVTCQDHLRCAAPTRPSIQLVQVSRSIAYNEWKDENLTPPPSLRFSYRHVQFLEWGKECAERATTLQGGTPMQSQFWRLSAPITLESLCLTTDMGFYTGGTAITSQSLFCCWRVTRASKFEGATWSPVHLM